MINKWQGFNILAFLTLTGVLHSLRLRLIGGTESELKWWDEAAGGGGVGCSMVIEDPLWIPLWPFLWLWLLVTKDGIVNSK